MALPSFGIIAHAIQSTLGISLPAVFHAARGDLSVEYCDDKLHGWSKEVLQRAGVTLEVSGVDNVHEHHPPFVVISNHQSLYDIPVLFQALPLSLRMAAKKELFSVPIWGRAMDVAGFVKIDRNNSERAYAALHVAGKRMSEDKLSLMIAPEGTRSRSGELLPFKNGAFRISTITGHPILPVAIDGTYRVLPSGQLTINRGQIVRVHILPPLFPADFSELDEYREAGRRAIEAQLRPSSNA